MINAKSFTAATLALLFLAACGSSGGLGDILGGGGSGASDYEIRGTIDHVDQNARVVYLTKVSGANRSMLSNGGSGNSVRVSYDENTTVGFQGQTFRVADLERGDEVSVQVDESGSNTLMAESMTVLRDSSDGTYGSSYPGSSSGSNSGYASNVRGTVRYIDTSRRTIEVDRGNGSIVTVEYDTATPVYYNNQTYRAGDLERGDEIDIRMRDMGSNRWVAQEISVVRNVSSGTFGGSSSSTQQMSTIRGTVRYVDTSRRTIELESATWASGFNTGANSGNRVIVSYGSNANVDVSGRMHPVSGLERGDVVEVQVQNSNATTPFAERIWLVRDVNNR
jgi:predicted RNA-binding protein with TRAM domain